MRVFAENPNSVLDEFSREFERGYLETLNSLHGTKRVKANTVYQEYIADKHHIHMNATIWTALTGFCMYLGKESKAIVDETEKGWFIQYIDRDPKVLARQAQAEQRQKFELDEEERRKRDIAAQVLAAEERVRNNGGVSVEDTEIDNSLVREDTDPKIAVSLAPPVVANVGLKKRVRQCAGFGQDSDSEDEVKEAKTEPSAAVATGLPPVPTGRGGGPSAASGVLARMMQEEEQRKRAKTQQHAEGYSSATPTTGIKESAVESNTNSGRNQQKDHKTASWLYKGLVVKVVSKEADKGRLYKLKRRVLRLLGRDYDEAEVEMDHDGRLHRLHVRDLETTIPKVSQYCCVCMGEAVQVDTVQQQDCYSASWLQLHILYT